MRKKDRLVILVTYGPAQLINSKDKDTLSELALAANLTLKEMQEHPTCIINAFDAVHNIIFWNNKCADHFGILPENAIGKKLESLIPWTKKDEKLAHIDRALMGRNMQVFDVPFRLREGLYEQRVIPVRNSWGQVIAALNMVEDLSQKKQHAAPYSTFLSPTVVSA